MIEIRNLTKQFEQTKALDGLNLYVEDGSVTGLVGSNGGGKSTLLRLLSGVYLPTSGNILIDGETVLDNPEIKGRCFFVPDFPYFYSSSTLASQASIYRDMYPDWSDAEYERLLTIFPIDRKQKILTMSKGMQRQAALILALSCCPQYLFLDEIFDGLDAVVRLNLKKLLIEGVSEKQMTVIIASHNLRELEELCDKVCLLHQGKVIVEKDIYTLRDEYRKVQVGFAEVPEGELFGDINAVHIFRNGNVFNITIKGSESEFMPKLEALSPAYISAMPLTLEEVFINEMEAAGYDTANIG